ncbi:MAG TPA: hypothetical protein VE093_08430 [Polyangiaceae bacterium]|jgi:hypothetical protein|nr:hypothetical protein [Polyangiaceae bacterium]
MVYARRSLLRRTLTAGAAVITLATASLGAGLAAGGCGEGATGGKRVTLATRAMLAEGAGSSSFTNAYGWSITLTRAAVSVGSLYYFDGAPIVSARLSPGGPGDGLGRWVGIKSAHAHPGHYEPGNTKGQMLEPSSVDLLEGPFDLPVGSGVSGIVRSARFSFASPPAGPAAALLGDHVVVVEGEAVKGDLVRPFVATADLADVLDANGEPWVEGCEFREVDVQADETVEVVIDPAIWLDQSEFDAVAESEDGSPVPLDRGGAAHKAFVRGLKKGSAYVFRVAS